ncbi:hypothetical protein RN70_07640 [Staphylococcus schleiferi]|uniref:MAG6450 family protein n=1 Tax=Staphylococcus coagulans TaxID=74706 RepID=UPI00067A24C7|nr:hypothetical protein [Staphylococcus coagulans]AKS69374.1 hypothetical protein NP71_07365 [Staphylococcus schleiferi]AKS71544.1 hypothetical protein OA96_06955 [Staphylococcus schleiferi]AKS73779.1 hypothetical protein RN70_07640 [Staphylococcus schleiferi]MBA8763480.1 hypothetical protein [Staphylococcus coagulans]MBT2809055.1 hypothetical protein [Staphylococcus coagulans]
MKLTNVENKHAAKGIKLANYKSRKFKIALGTELENNFCFKTKKPRKVTDGLHKFLEYTVYKDLSITEVDRLYLRTKGAIKEKVETKYSQLEILHYRLEKSQFRLFGFYDNNAYFNITKIDIDHKTHKQ